MCFLKLASKLFVATMSTMSILGPLCLPANPYQHTQAASAKDPATTNVKGWRLKLDMGEGRAQARSRSTRGRSAGLKTMLQTWAKGHCSAVAAWRLAHSVVKVDRSNCGYGMVRLAELAGEAGTTGGQKNCQRKLFELLAETALPDMIQEIPISSGSDPPAITHHLPPSEIIRMIHGQNRKKFGTIFGANKASPTSSWAALFSTDDGKEFKSLHLILRDRSPEQLQTPIPFHRP